MFEEAKKFILSGNPVMLIDAVVMLKHFEEDHYVDVHSFAKLILWMTESFPAVA